MATVGQVAHISVADDAMLARWISDSSAHRVMAGLKSDQANTQPGMWAAPHVHFTDSKHRRVYVIEGQRREVPFTVWREAQSGIAHRDMISHIVAQWPAGGPHGFSRTWQVLSGRIPDGVNTVVRPPGSVRLVNGSPRTINREVGPRDPDAGLLRPLVTATTGSRAVSVAFPDGMAVTPASPRRRAVSAPVYVNPLADVYAARITAGHYGIIPPRVHGMI
jgi:hypothetical protein